MCTEPPRSGATTPYGGFSPKPFAVALCLLLNGCALLEIPELRESRERVRVLTAERDVLQVRAETQDKELARLHLEMLDQNAGIKQLEARLDLRERDLAQAQAELQRVNARTRELTGPAEAAAAIAELEATLKAAEGQGKAEVTIAALVRGLLEASTIAYDRHNFAQAAGLADQALRLLTTDVTRHQHAGVRTNPQAAVALGTPVLFRVRVNSHVRSGPGMAFPPLTQVAPGSQVNGHATQGQWVNIEVSPSVRGWIYRKLLEVPR